ncbi:MAG: PTS transporter subunit IIC [Acinetobacter sp.]|uniref:PTS galactitol transporter subunit IIC n=1 Tax=Acinetobacter sp. TaxID=472 RepID=UPI002FCAC506
MLKVLEFFKGIGDAVSGMGSVVMVPVIIIFVGLFFRVNWKKAIKSGLLMGAGFQGISLVAGLLGQTLSPAAALLFERFNINLQFVDAGWAAAAGIAYSTQIGAFIIPMIILFNIIMLSLKLTKTVNIDIWNYWHYAFIGSLVFAMTGSLWLGVVGALAYCAFALRMADYNAPDVQEMLGIPGISIPQAASISTAPVAYVMEWVYDRIPGFKNWKLDATELNNKMGLLGDPITIGFILGAALGFLVGYDVKASLEMGVKLGAVMLLLPRMVKVIMEALLPVSEAAKEFMQKRFSGEEYYIGLDSAVAVGHSSAVATAVLIIPVYVLFTVLLPFNQVLPFGALAGTVYFGAIIGIVHKGDFLRTFITSVILVVIAFAAATYIGPMVTEVAQGINYAFPDGAAGITYFSPSGLSYLVILGALKYEIVGTVVLLAVLVVFFWLTRDKKVKKTKTVE